MSMPKSVLFGVGTAEHHVTREKILAAMNDFDLHYRLDEQDSGTKYAVEHDGKRYPPKRLLELATGVSRTRFSGGERTNSVYRGLGFEVLELADGRGLSKTAKELAKEMTRLRSPCPRIDQLLGDLFDREWVELHRDYSKLADAHYPGVYVLAFTSRDVLGQRVDERDVFYVGMSHAGVKQRLKQFIVGLEDGGHHSGAKTFFTKADRVPYSKLRSRKKFFVASVSIPCRVKKNHRKPEDLKKMGVVAALEWYVLARIKGKIGREPDLNKK